MSAFPLELTNIEESDATDDAISTTAGLRMTTFRG